MPLANLLSYRHHDAFPSDHRAEAQRYRNRDLNPWRDKFRGLVDVRFVVIQHLPIIGPLMFDEQLFAGS
jgi:hypothetical protein